MEWHIFHVTRKTYEEETSEYELDEKTLWKLKYFHLCDWLMHCKTKEAAIKHEWVKTAFVDNFKPLKREYDLTPATRDRRVSLDIQLAS